MDHLKSDTPVLSPTDQLLWSALEALNHTVRELGRFQYAGNYGDAIVVLCKLEAHFGVSFGDNPIAVLRELVELKDLKDSIYSNIGHKLTEEQEMARKHYAQRKPIAWEKARLILKRVRWTS